MVHVIIGEQVPKLLALRNRRKTGPDDWPCPSLSFAAPTAPLLLTVINGVTSHCFCAWCAYSQKGLITGQDSPPSVDELQILIEESRKAGKLAADETNIALARLGAARSESVRDVMMPLSLVSTALPKT
jgi:CBS domain containing-hemolysin-like protein